MGDEQGRFTNQIIDNTYQVNTLLGRGGMGEVYKGSRFKENTPVGIKFLTTTTDPNLAGLFTKEADALHKLQTPEQHPNIIPFYRYDVFRTGREAIPYIVMGFAPGGSLQDLMNKQGLLSLDQSMDVLLQVATGLEHSHSKKILHRDIKPANVLLDRERVSRKIIAMLSDFGIILTLHSLNSLAANFTTAQIPPPLGTVQYMAPEQFIGQERTPSDIYSLGIMAYQMLTGQLPFTVGRKENQMALIMAHHIAHSTSQPPPFREKVATVSPPLEEVEPVIFRAIAKKPEERYQSVGEFSENLRDGYSRGLQREQRQKYLIDMARRTSLEKALANPNAIKGLLGSPIETPFNIEYLPKETLRAIEGLMQNWNDINLSDFWLKNEEVFRSSFFIRRWMSKGSTNMAKWFFSIMQGKYTEALEMIQKISDDDYLSARGWKSFRDNGLKHSLNYKIAMTNLLATNKEVSPPKLWGNLESSIIYSIPLNIEAINHERFGRYEEALLKFREVESCIFWEDSDESEEVYSYYGASKCLVFLGKFETALEYSDKALMLHPRFTQAYNTQGTALLYLKRYEEALEAFNKAISINPEYPYAYIGKSTVLHILGKSKEAQEAFQIGKKMQVKRKPFK